MLIIIYFRLLIFDFILDFKLQIVAKWICLVNRLLAYNLKLPFSYGTQKLEAQIFYYFFLKVSSLIILKLPFRLRKANLCFF